jgi:exonuclease III
MMAGEVQGMAGRVFTIMSLNINSLSSATRVDMLHQFIRRSEVDIMLLQEVTSMEALQMRGYVAYGNIGVEMRGTGILAREGIRMEHVERTP